MVAPSARRVLLVVPVHDRPEETRELLESLVPLGTGGLDLTIVIIDDGSSTPLQPLIEDGFPGLTMHFLRNEVARGPAYCRNLACRGFDSDFIWFLDSDTEIIGADIMVAMVAWLDSDPNIAAVGGQIEPIRGDLRVLQMELQVNFLTVARGIRRESFSSRRVDVLATANMMVRRVDFDRFGPFDENLARDEDTDLCLAMKRKGRFLYQGSDTLVLHKLSGSGRESGHFSSFLDANDYISDMLSSRIHLLTRYRPWRLLVLPVLDLLACTKILYLIMKKSYLIERIGKVNSTKKWAFILFLVSQNLRSYMLGCRLIAGRVFR